MAKSPRICVVGSANVDLTFRTPRMPKTGETLAGHSLHTGMGGKGANQAVAAARLGARVTFVACVGNDTFGMEAIHHYCAEGIDTSFVRQDARCATGTAAIVVDDQAENFILYVPGANANLAPEDVRKASAAIQNADIVLCQLETPVASTIEAFRLARTAGVMTVLTPAPVMDVPDQLLQLCDLCVPNKTETEHLAKCPVDTPNGARAAAYRLRARGVQSVAMTLGSSGALLVNDAGALDIPAIQVQAVDPTGAGDAFTAAMAVSLAEGVGLKESALWATLVAALSVTRLGAQMAFPSLADVNEFAVSKNPRLYASHQM
jgi:ribokinase